MNRWPRIVNVLRDWPARGVSTYNAISFLLLVVVSCFMLKDVRSYSNLMFSSGVLATITALLVAIMTDGSTKRLLCKMRKSGLVRVAPHSLRDIVKEHIRSNIKWHMSFVLVLAGAGLLYVHIQSGGSTEPYFFAYLLTALRFRTRGCERCSW